jgi:hypothetical protein
MHLSSAPESLDCDVCGDLNATPGSNFRREVDFGLLKQSALNGCQACTAIQDAISSYPEPLGLENIRSLRLYSQSTGAPLFVEPKGPTSANEDPLYIRTLELFTVPGRHENHSEN